MAAPATDQPGTTGKVGMLQIAARGMGVLDQNLIHSRIQGGLTNRHHLLFHLQAVGGIILVFLARLIPVVDAANPLDVGADVYFHPIPPQLMT